MGRKRGVCRVLVGRPQEKRPLEDLGVDVRISLRSGIRQYVLV
jgi:hypothetical protein